jgi:alpha-L-fucosidase 2
LESNANKLNIIIIFTNIMNCKLTTSLLLTAMVMCQSVNAAEKPQFSSANSDHWYYLIFSSGDAAMQDMGANAKAMTRTLTRGNEGQLWKLVGDENSFTLQSQLGNIAYYDGFIYTSTDASKATQFKLVPTNCSLYPGDWEIEMIGKDDDYNHVNQNGGGGIGHTIITWTPDDQSNVLEFFAENDIPEVPTIGVVKEYKVAGSTTYAPEHRHTLWYTNPVTAETVADPWMEYALPIGNGDFGAMVYGGVHRDCLQFNDKSLWTGSTDIRGSYQNFGDLYIEDTSDVFGATDDKALTDYYRNLDLSQAVASAHYTTADGSVAYTREYIASYPDKVVAVHLKATKPGSISVRVTLDNGVKKGFITAAYADGCGAFEGKLDLLNFKAKFKVVPVGGSMTTTANGVEVTGADELLIVLAGATNFDMHSAGYVSDADAMRTLVDERVNAAASKGWESLLADHLADYTPLYNRFSLEIAAAENAETTNKLVSDYNARKVVKDSPACMMLEELYFNFGRYLLVGSSRGMDLPANLQGIWNNSASPAWQCDIHSNINVEMNYWPAEITNLSEMHAPYLNYIYSMVFEHPQWQQYAQQSGQTKGWTCFTQNNIFGNSNYAENYVIANAWYSTHLWQHYIYTLDRDFLKSQALPVMISCCEFWLERLIKDADNTWVAPQEWSPEHGPGAEDGTAHAQQIVTELFSNTLAAIAELGDDANVSADFVSELTDKYNNLDKGLAIEKYTGAWGDTLNGINNGDDILREWKTSDYSAGESEHRHQSHLMAMYPFSQITPESPYFQAAVNSLKLRGDVSTGWSLGWRICLWARALDGEHGHTLIRSALRHATSYTQSNGAGGVYYNLFDSHAPFQIDGNFGFTTGVTEMLLQSYNGTIRLLPALPSIWKAGSIHGVKAVGNFEIDEKWDNCLLQTAKITSNAGKECKLNGKDIANAKITDGAGKDVVFAVVDNDNISFSTEAGATYTIDLTDNSALPNVVASNLRLTVVNGVVSVNVLDAAAAKTAIVAYDMTGRLVASSATSSLDLSAFRHTPLVVTATTPTATLTQKLLLN